MTLNTRIAATTAGGGRGDRAKALPAELRAEVERRLGARVTGVRPTPGGFSWGVLDPAELFEPEAERLDAFLVALAGYWTHTATLPGPVHAPHLRRRRENSRRLTIGWLRRRWEG
ncbi:hypothetical protein ACFXJ8_07860 [Nonomuraea sp. NPDC059194]|uniref:hypothetical protein n=1 Tax=Nonomuraea sp. NPDC059194 TaxID=3346764 RepID=UPI0036A1FE54